MGFSQKASCKAKGLLKRTSKNKGKYVISHKYKDGASLYSNGKKSRTKFYANQTSDIREAMKKKIKKKIKKYINKWI